MSSLSLLGQCKRCGYFINNLHLKQFHIIFLFLLLFCRTETVTSRHDVIKFDSSRTPGEHSAITSEYGDISGGIYGERLGGQNGETEKLHSKVKREIGHKDLENKNISNLEGCLKGQCRGVRKQRPVCGSDGRTYPSNCHLRGENRCRNIGESSSGGVVKVSDAPCPGETKCQSEQRTALFDSALYQNTNLYVPNCRSSDGSYTPIQCHNYTGYCWCVTPQGRPLRGSVLISRTRDLICPNSTDGRSQREDEMLLDEGRAVDTYSTNYRRDGSGLDGQSRLSGRTKKEAMPGERRTERSKKRSATRRRSCNKNDRVLFSYRLIEMFDKEFVRSQQNKVSASPQSRMADVATWKFTELDSDKDGKIRRKELKNLRRMSIKLVKPRPCAKTFQIYCDTNNDKRIELSEWLDCMTNHSAVDIEEASKESSNNHDTTSIHRGRGENKPRLGRIPPSILRPNGNAGGNFNDQSEPGNVGHVDRKKNNRERKRKGLTGADEEEGSSESFLTLISRERPSKPEASSPIGLVPSRGRHNPGVSHNLQPSSCVEERRKALELNRTNPRAGVYVPECETDGKFRKAQCHNNTGYCWCVDVNSGIPIPGVSSQHELPDCDEVKHRQFKGCSFTAKKRFQTAMLDRMTQQMVDHANSNPSLGSANNRTSSKTLTEPDPDQSIEERAVRWKLVTLDKDGNQILDRRELRELRKELKALGGGASGGEGPPELEGIDRKCRRNFIKYCDENSDNEITLSEWIECSGLNDKQSHLPENPRRKGSNPFSNVLKSSR